MNKLHPGARWFFRLGAYRVLLIIGIIFSVWTFKFVKVYFEGVGTPFIMTIIFYIVFVIIVGEIYARMSYNRWLFEINEDGVKLEHGIIWKKYTSIPYERVQNVDIRRGIIARMLGFSTLDIETAGRSGFSYGRGNKKYKSEGHLPAVDINEAERIREFVMKKIKKSHRSQEGL